VTLKYYYISPEIGQLHPHGIQATKVHNKTGRQMTWTEQM